MSLLATILGQPVVGVAVRLLGLAMLAGTVTALVSFVFRVRVREIFPEGATLILGLGVVAIYLNTRLIFIQFVGEGSNPLTFAEAVLNVSVFIVAGIASYGGRYVGTKAGASDELNWGRLQPNLSPIVRATGRFITVTLPETIEDIEGYDEVAEETKEVLSGRKFDFPRGLTVDDLQLQLMTRLKEEYDIGYVDVEMTADGNVEYLGVGQRAAGIGPTLPPKSAAVAVKADPPFSATSGDTVQLWRTGEDGNEQRLGTAELRASVESVATVATDETVANKVDPTANHRLMTLSADAHPEREFAGMLRRGDETMSIIEVTGESPLVGNSVSAVDVTIIAVRSAGGDVETIPKRDRLIQAGDNLFAIGRPDALRKLESSKGTQVLEGEGRTVAAGATDLELGEETSRKEA